MSDPDPKSNQSSFAEAGKKERDASVVTEFLRFLKHNKRWWMLPILLILLALGWLVIASSGAGGVFIYSIF